MRWKMKNKLIENIIENKPYYEEDAEYIKIFKTNENNVATIKLANQALENYQEYGITLVKIELTMEFYEVGSSVIDEWFHA